DVGKVCKMGTDCRTLSCSGTVCLVDTCNDGIRNGAETDVDCGGGKCRQCSVGQTCAAGADCLSRSCAGGKCASPTCTDGVQNGAETGKDCGGGVCKKCD